MSHDNASSPPSPEFCCWIDQERLKQLLPHQGNALLIDKALVYPQKYRGDGFLTTALAMHVFDGHFPGRPIMPGHWLIEFASLTCATIFTVSSGIPITGTAGVRIVAIDGIRFKAEVRPGDELICAATLIQRKKILAYFSATIRTRAEGKEVCRIKELVGILV